MGGQSKFCQIITSESLDFYLLKDKGTCKPAQNTFECVFLFSMETCDTSTWWDGANDAALLCSNCSFISDNFQIKGTFQLSFLININ